jgi:hypothetical protein
MDEAKVSAAVHEVLGTGGDETILEYLCGVLCDEHFPWDETFDHVGGIMVRRARRGFSSCSSAFASSVAVGLQWGHRGRRAGSQAGL